MQIQLSDRWLLTLNATAEVVDMVLPEGNGAPFLPFAGEDNPVIMAVWHGPAHGVCVFQRS
jgi:glycogen operon protein